MRGAAGRIDRPFLIALAVLVVFGLVVLTSASGPLGFQEFGSSWYFVQHQVLFGLLPGIVIFSALAWFDYRKFKPFAFACLILSILLLLMVYMPGIGERFGGAGRWVKLGPISFQPSEFVKVLFLIYVAGWLEAKGEQVKSLGEGLVPFLIPLAIVGVLLFKQPNTGSTAIILISAFAAYFMAGAPIVWFGAIAVGVVGVIALLIKITPYRAARFTTFLHPELDPKGVGYQINQALLAVGSGGMFGLGYGQSRQKYLYLPEVDGDSIFAIMAEELGFFITVAFLALVAYIVRRCFVIADRAPDAFGRYLVVGIGSWIAIQTVFNVCSMIGLLPLTGVTLPFVSYGSSAFIALAAGCGIVASVSRRSTYAAT